MRTCPEDQFAVAAIPRATGATIVLSGRHTKRRKGAFDHRSEDRGGSQRLVWAEDGWARAGIGSLITAAPEKTRQDTNNGDFCVDPPWACSPDGRHMALIAAFPARPWRSPRAGAPTWPPAQPIRRRRLRQQVGENLLVAGRAEVAFLGIQAAIVSAIEVRADATRSPPEDARSSCRSGIHRPSATTYNDLCAVVDSSSLLDEPGLFQHAA
jgi:hypothetical protein